MSRTGVTVTRDDKGLKELARQLEAMDGISVVAGVTGPGAKVTYENGKTVEYVAERQEFGTDAGIPARSFMRRTYFEKRGEIKDLMAKKMGKGFESKAKAIEAVGEVGGEICNMIRATLDSSKSWAKPLAPSTVARKGDDQPLKDTGQLRNAIAWEVRSGSGTPLGSGK